MSIGFSTMNTGMADTVLKQSIINSLIAVNSVVLNQAEISELIRINKRLDTCAIIVANTNINDTYERIPVDSSGGAITLTLAADSAFNIDKEIHVCNVANSANNIIVNTDGTAKFYGYGISGAGVTTLTIAVVGGQLAFYKFSTNKYFVYLKQLT